MRLLNFKGIFSREIKDNVSYWKNNALSNPLRYIQSNYEIVRKEHPNYFRKFVLYFCRVLAEAERDLLHSVKTGESSFSHQHKMHYYDYLTQNPELEELFAEFMNR